MKDLDLSSNQLNHDACVAIQEMLHAQIPLVNLNLSWNSIRGQGADDIAEGLAFCNLRTCDLSWNGFNTHAVPSIAQALILNQVRGGRGGEWGLGFHTPPNHLPTVSALPCSFKRPF